MSKQQTAVDWLFNQLPDHLRLSRNGFDMLQQAKEMEKNSYICSQCKSKLDGKNMHQMSDKENNQ